MRAAIFAAVALLGAAPPAGSPAPAPASAVPVDATPAALPPATMPATAAPAASPAAAVVPRVRITPAPYVSHAPIDRAISLVGPPWSCETFTNDEVTSLYRVAGPYDFTVASDLQASPERAYRIGESYHFDPKTAHWRATVSGNAFVGIAERWLGDKWVFEGVATANGIRHSARMIYTDLGPNAFRRDFLVDLNGKYRVYSAETCSRGV